MLSLMRDNGKLRETFVLLRLGKISLLHWETKEVIMRGREKQLEAGGKSSYQEHGRES